MDFEEREELLSDVRIIMGTELESVQRQLDAFQEEIYNLRTALDDAKYDLRQDIQDAIR